MTVLGVERREPPVVEHEDLGLGERLKQLRVASVGAGDGQRAEQPGQAQGLPGMWAPGARPASAAELRCARGGRVQLGPQMVASQPKPLDERWKRGWELLREIGTLERYVRELRE